MESQAESEETPVGDREFCVLFHRNPTSESFHPGLPPRNPGNQTEAALAPAGQDPLWTLWGLCPESGRGPALLTLGRKYLCVVCAYCLVSQSGPTLCDPMDCSPPGSSVHGDSPGKNTGVGCHAFLQGIFVVSICKKKKKKKSKCFGTRDQFCGKRFSHGPGSGGWFQDDSSAYIYRALYFYDYCISSTSDHQALEPEAGDPWSRPKAACPSMAAHGIL